MGAVAPASSGRSSEAVLGRPRACREHRRVRRAALADGPVAGTGGRGRRRGRAATLATRTLAPLAARHRAGWSGAWCARGRPRADDGVRSVTAQAVGTASRRQRDLPLDGRREARDARPPIRQTIVRSSPRRGTRPTRPRAARSRTSRPSTSCRARSSDCRRSCSRPSARSPPTRPSVPRSVRLRHAGRCCCSRPGCRSLASCTRPCAPISPVAATWSSL